LQPAWANHARKWFAGMAAVRDAMCWASWSGSKPKRLLWGRESETISLSFSRLPTETEVER
jgi:hypothetical protein